MTNAYKYLMHSGGIEEESSYPYTGKRGECKFEPEKVAVKVAKFTTISRDENQIAANLVHRGPLAGNVSRINWAMLSLFENSPSNVLNYSKLNKIN